MSKLSSQYFRGTIGIQGSVNDGRVASYIGLNNPIHLLPIVLCTPYCLLQVGLLVGPLGMLGM